MVLQATLGLQIHLSYINMPKKDLEGVARVALSPRWSAKQLLEGPNKDNNDHNIILAFSHVC